jgi:hypothetical protein
MNCSGDSHGMFESDEKSGQAKGGLAIPGLSIEAKSR